VVDRAGVRRGDGAALLERRAQLAHLLEVDDVRALVPLDDRDLAPAALHLDGHDLGRERAVLGRRLGAAVGAFGEVVLRLARERVAAGARLRAGAHVLVVVDVPEAVVDQRVDDLRVAQAQPAARAGQQVGRARHRLLPAADADPGVPGEHGAHGLDARLHAAAAHIVDRDGGRADVQAGEDRRLPRRGLALAGLQAVAHEHRVDVAGPDAGALQRTLDRGGAELPGLQAREPALEGADGRARRGGDDCSQADLLRPRCAARFVALTWPRRAAPT